MFPALPNRQLSQRDISNSRAFYPAVGLLLGLILVGVQRGAEELFPVYLTAAILVVLMMVLTRALHMDGFMDLCDGMFGGYSRERRLEIMRDSQVGAFAVAGAVGITLLKYAAMVSLLSLREPGKEWALLLFPMLSRWVMVLLLGAFPYVRGQGLGSPFHDTAAPTAAVIAASTAVIAALLLGAGPGIGLLIGISAAAWLFGKALVNSLGGLTGDTYGAANELAETSVLIAAVPLVSHRWLEPLTDFIGVT